MRILGIDPGLDGGLAIYQSDGQLVTEVMPTLGSGKRTLDAGSLADWLRHQQRDQRLDGAMLELVGAMPGQGVTSMFTFGEGYGLVKGVLAVLRIPYTLVSPRKWQGAVIGATAKGDSKGAAAVRAAQLFPGYNFKATARSKKPHEGMVDAALLAYYGLHVVAMGKALESFGTGKPSADALPPKVERFELYREVCRKMGISNGAPQE